MWFELIRTIRMVRPKYFILENVSAILANGLDIVLRDIYETGLYECEWCCIPSSFVGACHQRDRWWLIGLPSNSYSMQRLDVLRQESEQRQETQQGISDTNNRSGNVADSNNNGSFRTEKSRSIEETNGRFEERKDIFIKSEGSGKSTNSGAFQQSSSNSESKRTWKDKSRLWGQSQGGDMQTDRDSNKKISDAPNSDSKRLQREVGSRLCRATWKTQNIRRINPNWRQYESKPVLCRGDDGLRNRVDRLKALGNSVVPQCAAIPLQRVLDLENERQA